MPSGSGSLETAHLRELAMIDSTTLVRALSSLLGILYTLAWSLSFYPQILLNLRRRSTSGTTPSFPVLNVLGFLCYTLSTSAFLTSATVRQQYQDRHHGTDNTVRWNDLAFAFHALLMSVLTLSQFFPTMWKFEPRRCRVGNGVWIIVFASVIGVLWMIGLVLFNGGNGYQWLDVVYAVGYVKLLATLVKYVPQAYHNFQRKSTSGWSIQPMLLDFSGGVLSLAQLFVDSSLEGDWSGVTGNPIKLGLGNISITFDILFMIQHYVLYREKSRDQVSERETDGLLGGIDES